MDTNETTRPVCSCCGATIETDDYYTFEGSILCDDCYHSETVTCEHCGDRIWADRHRTEIRKLAGFRRFAGRQHGA